MLKVLITLLKPELKKHKKIIVSYVIRQVDRENNNIYGMNLSRKPVPFALISFVLLLMSFDIYLKPKGRPILHSKIEGMLMGSAIGDAAGGPVEFVDPPLRSVWANSIGIRVDEDPEKE